MSVTQAPAEAGISKADLDKAVAEAVAKGLEEGHKAVAEAVAKGLEEGRKAESARLAGIEGNMVGTHVLPDCAALIAGHKADASMTPEKSALAVLAAIKARPVDANAQNVAAGLAKLAEATAGVVASPSGGAGGLAAPAADAPDGWKAEFAASKDLQGEFGSADAYAAFKQAEANGQIRILKSRAA